MPIPSSPSRATDVPATDRARPTRRPVRRLATAAAGLAVVVAVAAGCSSTSTTSSTGTTAAPTGTSAPSTEASSGSGTTVGTTKGSVPASTSTTAKAGTSTTTAKPATSTTSTTTGSTPPRSGDVSPSTPTTSVVRAEADAAFCARVDQAQQDFSDLDPSSPNILSLYQSTLKELAALAPAGIKAQVELLNTAIQKATSVQELSQMQTAELDAAGTQIDDWTKVHCGATIGGD